jgi:FkbM family methyltransferase
MAVSLSTLVLCILYLIYNENQYSAHRSSLYDVDFDNSLFRSEQQIFDYVRYADFPEGDILIPHGVQPEVTSPRDSPGPRCHVYRKPLFVEPGMKCVNLTTLRGRTPICTFDPHEDRMISAYVFDYGTWEPDLLNATGEVLLADPDLQFIDLGCNIGVFTLFAVKLGKTVIAVDPVKSCLNLLQRSLYLGKFRKKVVLLLNAISDVHESVELEIERINMGGTHVKPAGKTATDDSTVSTILLDDLLEVVTFRRAFLKMDIEGYELNALRGAARFFRAVDVRYILMEWMLTRNSARGQAIIDWLVTNGYLPYTHPDRTTLLEPKKYALWPDNIFWIKR